MPHLIAEYHCYMSAFVTFADTVRVNGIGDTVTALRTLVTTWLRVCPVS